MCLDDFFNKFSYKWMKIFIAFLEIDEKRKEKVLHHEKQ
jgi:hypothetical protein